MSRGDVWPRVPISALYEGLYDGPHGTPPPASDGPVFLGIGNITDDGHLDLSAIRHIAVEDFPRWTKRVTPRPGDLVFTYEATLNRYALIPEGFVGCLGRRLALIRPDTSKVDTRFLYYSMFSPEWRETIERNRLAGATVDRIPLSKFPNFPIAVPELSIQHRIGAILAAYDDLIEANQRRISIMEEMSRRLFEEWFVRFRFPGHEAASTPELANPALPSGWRRVALGELCARVTDGAHYSPPSVADGMFMASVRDMRDWGFDLSECRKISDSDYQELVRADCQPLVGDILIAKDGANLNKHTFLIWKDEPIVILSSIAIIRPSDAVFPEFLVATLKSAGTSAAIKQMKSGAAIPRIVLKDFRRLPVILPPSEVCAKFDGLVAPIHMSCRQLVETNLRLRAARALLLPKLISGEIPIGAAERELEDAA